MKRARLKARRYLAAALALMLCLSLLPMSAMATDGGYYEVTDSYYKFKIMVDTGYTSITEYTKKDSNGKADISGSVVIPGTVTRNGTTYTVSEIGNIFYGAAGLTGATIPDTVTTLNGTFQDCTGLTGVTIPASVTTIGDSAFYGCSSLASVTFAANSELSSIGKNAFAYCTKLTSVSLPSGMTSLGEYAFSGCTGLAGSLTLPSGITTIGSDAFQGCSGLTSVTLPTKLTTLGAGAFSQCTKLAGTVTIPAGVTAIPNYAFNSCSALTGVVLVGAVTAIGDTAFSGCYKLTSFTLPDTVTTIGAHAFEATGITSITLPANLTAIGISAFSGSGLTSITIPSKVTAIADYTFFACNDLTTVTLPVGLTSIGDNAFLSCGKLASVNLPNTLTSIGDCAFMYCKSLPSVVIPDSVTTIGQKAFENCTSLKSATISKSVTSIAYATFGDCTSLPSITIPEGVTEVGRNAFGLCTNLTKVTLPSTLKSVYAKAFDRAAYTNGAFAAHSVDYGGTAAQWTALQTWNSDANTGINWDKTVSKDSGNTGNDYLLPANNATVNTSKAAQAALTITSLNTVSLGTTLNLAATGGSSGKTVVWTVTSGTGSATVSGSTLTPVSVGTVTVTATMPGDDSYKDVSATQEITVAPQAITAAVADIADQTYTGSAIEPAVTVTDGSGHTLTLNTDYTVTYGTNTAVGVGAGSVTVSAKVGGSYTFSDVVKSFNIVKAASTVSLSGSLTKTYDKIAAAVPTVTVTGSTGTQTVTYYVDKACTERTDSTNSGAASSGEAPVFAGTYYVKAAVDADDNYNRAVSSPMTFTIAKASCTVSPQSASYIRTSSHADQTLDLYSLLPTDCGTTAYTVQTSGTGVTKAVVSGNTLYYTTAVQDAACTATITVTVTMQNYADTNIVLTVNLTDKNPVTISGLTAQNGTYNGNEQPGYTGTPVFSDNWSGTPTYTYYSGSTTTGTPLQNAPTGAGEYTLRVAIPDTDPTYTGHTDIHFTISKAVFEEPGSFLYADSRTYNGETGDALSVSATIYNGYHYEYSTTGENGPYSETCPQVRNVSDSKTIWVKISDPDYETAYQSYDVAITPAPLTISDVAATGRTYDGTTTVALTGGTLSGVVDGDTVGFTLGSGIAANKNAGTQNVTTSITLTGKDSNNYNLTQPTVTVNISKATLTITAENKTIITGSALPAYTVTYTGFAAGDTKESVIATDAAAACPTADKDKAGTYPITVSGAALNTGYDVNYNLVFVPGTLTVSDKTAADVTLTGVPTAAKTYGDSAFTVTASAASTGTNGVWNWTSSDPDVLSVSGSGAAVTVTILKSGSAKLTANYSSDTTVGQAESAVITVNKANLNVRPKSVSINTGSAMPTPEVEYAGLKNSDTSAEVTLSRGTLTMQIQDGNGTALADTKTAGSYPIVFTDSPVFNVSDKYTITVSTGTLTVSAPAPAGGGSSAGAVTVPASSDAGSVKVSAKVADNTATIAPTDAQIAAVASASKETGTVVIDLSSLDVDAAVVPEKLVSAAQKADKSQGLAVVLPAGKVELDKTALNAAANKGDIKLSVQTVPESKLTETQKNVLGSQSGTALVVDVDLLANGVKLTDFSGGQLTVSVPYTLKAGEDASRLVVWFIKDDGTLECRAASYDAKTASVTFTTTHLSRYIVAEFPFTDVPSDSYYYTAAAWAVNNGITGGKASGIFAPSDTCTRAQVVTFLWRAMGSPEPSSTVCPFADVNSNAYYYKAVLWAVEKGITKGTTDTTFSPDAAVSRAQTVTFQWRAAGSPASTAANPFVDVASDAYYAGAVAWAVSGKITGGTTATTFSPANPCTRAQIVTFLWRQLDK